MALQNNVRETLKGFIQAALDDTYFTPDMPVLCQKEEHYLFTYGTLKKGFCRNHFLTNGGTLIGSGFTLDSDFVLYRQNKQYSFPIAFKTDLHSINGHIGGELWLIKTNKLIELDFVESNGTMYYREEVPVVIHPYAGKDKMVVATAQMYLGVPGYWRDKIPAKEIRLCDKLRRKKDEKFQYYNFMRKWDFSSKKV
jgi:gamma-glutamylcyclotransferase (GGCT)/AIG2-like uncharacterized protein YtfP